MDKDLFNLAKMRSSGLPASSNLALVPRTSYTEPVPATVAPQDNTKVNTIDTELAAQETKIAQQAIKENPEEIPIIKSNKIDYLPSKYSSMEKFNTELSKLNMSEDAKRAILAQAGLESGWGKTSQSRLYHNYGNITAGSSWKGKTVKGGDKDAEGNKITQDWRVYDSMEDSMNNYVSFIKRLYPQAYSALTSEKFNIDDFTKGLVDNGVRKYATHKDYQSILKGVYGDVQAAYRQNPSLKQGGTLHRLTNTEMKRDWLNSYSTAQPQAGTRKFQEGGAMAAPAPEEGGAPAGPEGAPEGGGNELDAMLAEYAQSRDPQLAVAICDSLVEMVAQQGGAPAGPEGAPAPEGAPMARNGAKLRGPIFNK